MQADAFDGYNQLYKAQRKPAPILEAACWSHGRRKFFDLAKSGEAPIASEAVRRIDELFEIERAVNGQTPEQRLAARREKSRPLVADLGIWMRQQRALLSSSNDTAKAINYLLNRWAAFTRFLDDGRVCLSNNAAERALRGVASLESLCAPSLSACKHWKRVRVNVATRATLSGDRRFDRLGFQIGGPNLTGRSRNNLHSRKNAAGDKAAYHMA